MFLGCDFKLNVGEVVVLVVFFGLGKLMFLYIVGFLDEVDEGLVMFVGIDMVG